MLILRGGGWLSHLEMWRPKAPGDKVKLVAGLLGHPTPHALLTLTLKSFYNSPQLLNSKINTDPHGGPQRPSASPTPSQVAGTVESTGWSSPWRRSSPGSGYRLPDMLPGAEGDERAEDQEIWP